MTDRSNIAANRRVVDDWLEAVERDREPVCSGFAAMKSLEMIHAVFAAGLARARVALPLLRRSHPLEVARGLRLPRDAKLSWNIDLKIRVKQITSSTHDCRVAVRIVG